MIGYATIGTNNLEKATTFYDKVMETLGGRRTFAMGDRMQFYGSREAPGMVAIAKPYDEQPATATTRPCDTSPTNSSADSGGASSTTKPGTKPPPGQQPQHPPRRPLLDNPPA